MCRGFAQMEAQLLLVAIARRFRLRGMPGHTAVPQALVTLRPRGGLPMIVEQA